MIRNSGSFTASSWRQNARTEFDHFGSVNGGVIMRQRGGVSSSEPDYSATRSPHRTIDYIQKNENTGSTTMRITATLCAAELLALASCRR